MDSKTKELLLKYFDEESIEGDVVNLCYTDINGVIPIDAYMRVKTTENNELKGKIYVMYEIDNNKGEMLIMTLNIGKEFKQDMQSFFDNFTNLESTPYDMKKLWSIRIPDEQSNIWVYHERINRTIYTGGNPLYNKYLYPPNDTFFAFFIHCVLKDRLIDVESELPSFIRQITLSKRG